MKHNRIVLLMVALLAALVGLVACDGAKDQPSNVKAGPEKGVYYYDSTEGEYTLELADGSVAVLTALGSEIRGSYKLNGTKLVITLKGVSTAAKYENDQVEMTYNNETMTLIRKTEYTVSFESNGGSAVEAVKAINGRSISKPTDPKYAGHGFMGWYTDEACTKEFEFGTSKVTGNITLYAKWAEPTANDRTVSFDMGEEYKGETPKSVLTVHNRLYDVETPVQSGYTFKGWWISQYDEREKLSYKWESETVIKADITLYAVWEKTGEKTPSVNVGENGISWDKQDVTVTLKVEGPEGYGTTENTYGTTASAEKEIDFKTAPAGDYVITLNVGDKAYSVYYKNKALDQVSGFEVKNNSVLRFAKVDNASGYVISVECGDPTHKHTMLDIGSEPEYDFGNCEMQKDGITFTVYAKADGYAMSTGRKYNHEAHLSRVTGLKVNNDGVLSWDKVEHAEKYIIQINDGKEIELTDNSYDVRKYTGDVTVSVYAKAHGYNSVEGSEHKYKNEKLAMPANIGVFGQEISWDSVENATGYEVTIDGKTQSVTENKLNLEAMDWQAGKTYSITVKAIGANNSSYVSDVVRIIYGTEIENLQYDKSVLSWDAVVGADRYEIRVNDGAPQEVAKGQRSATVTLTGKTNVLSVRMYYADGNASAWSSVTIDAYEVTIDTQDGKAVNKFYRAQGDIMGLPEVSRVGYTFINWYNAPENGRPYTDDRFNLGSDVTLYAYWNANKYTVNLNYGVYGEELTPIAELAYDSNYTLPVPDTKDGRMMFIGWYSSGDGNGLQYTDSFGVSNSKWINTTDNVTLYAYFLEMFKFTEDGEGYAVSKGNNISRGVHLKIPAEYNGKPVVSIVEYGFQSCNSTLDVALPNTMISIPATAFSGSGNIAKFIVYDAGNADPLFFADEDSGALLYNNYATGATEIYFAPSAVTGTFTIPDGVTHIGTNVFRRSKVSAVVIPTSVTYIAQDAFVSMDNLTDIIFASVKPGEAAKPLNMSPKMVGSNCAKLKKIVLPARLMAFQTDGKPLAEVINWFRLVEQITVEQGDNDKNPNIAYSSDENGILLSADGSTIIYFPQKSTLTKYEAPSSVTKIAANAFNNYIGQTSSSFKSHLLEEVVLHSNITGIGERAFYKSTKLTKVTFKSSALPGSCKIGKEAFSDCYALATVDFQEKGALNAREKETEDGTVTEYIYTFTESCGIVEIGERAFYSCAIGSIVLPSTLTTLGKEAFRNNKSLASLDLGHINSELVFDDYVFQDCTKLVNVPISANVGLIPLKGVFKGCGVKTFTVAEENPYYEMGEDGVLYNRGQTKIMYYPAGREGKYIIPSTVDTISSGVFMDVPNLEEITIPTSVTLIDSSAFQNCANLSKVTFDVPTEGKGGNLIIGDNAFNGCMQLKTIELPARTVSIGNQCFYRSGLTSISLNEGLESIGREEINGNTISATYVFANLVNLKSITIPSTVTFIGQLAFYGAGLTSVEFAKPAEGETTNDLIMGVSAFNNCKILKEIELPERLQYIPQSAFNGCISLEKVIIPTTVGNTDGVRGVGAAAFSGCTELSQVLFAEDIKSDEPATVDATGASAATLKQISFGAIAFYNCASLTEITLPARAGSMNTKYDVFETYSYNGAVSDLMLTFASSSNSAISSTFANIYIQKINVTSGGNFDSYDGVLYTKDCKELVYCPQGREGEVEISKNAASMLTTSFAFCKKITKITFQDANDTALDDFEIPDVTGTSGYNYPFYYCNLLTEINFPARLKSLGEKALYRDISINSGENAHNISIVTFAPNCRLESIGKNAFCQTLVTEIVLPTGVTQIGTTPFANYKGTSLTITLPRMLDSTSIGNLRNVDKSAMPVLVIAEDSLIDEIDGIVYTIDDGKRAIAYCTADPANFNAADKTTLTIPYDVEIIAVNAFKDIKRYNKVVFEPAPKKPETEGPEGEATLSEESETEKAYELEICNSAFQGSGITEIELPARVKSLGTGVFYLCSSLASVTFEDGYSYSALPTNTFRSTIITSIKIPDSVTTIGSYAFGSCSKLGSVTFGENSALEDIVAYAFNGCTSLTAIDIPRGVTKLGSMSSNGSFTEATASHTFAGCTKLETVNFLGNSLEYIGQFTFNGCTKLKYINKPENDDKHDAVLPSGLLKIGASAFASTTSLLNISIPDSLTYIGASAFKSSGIQHLFMSENDNCQLDQICDSAFESSKLVDFYIPNSLTKLCTKLEAFDSVLFSSSSAFKNCTNLSTVRFGTSCGLTVFGKSTFEGCTNLKDIKIPGGVLRIGDDVFKGCTKLTDIDFSANTVEYIGTAFTNCSALQTITLPTSLVSLGVCTGLNPPTKVSSKKVFSGCTSLEYIKIPSGVTVIHSNLFEGCAKLKTVVFNRNIELIGGTTFKGCTALTTIRYDDPPVKDPESEEEIEDPADGVIDLSPIAATTIPSNMFENCSSVTTVKLADSITSIGINAFNGCSKLASIDLPTGLITLGATGASSNGQVFSGCTSLMSIDIPNGVTILGYYAFYNCTNLTTVKVGSLTNINAAAFVGCPNVTFAESEGGETEVVDGAVYSGTTLIAYKGTSTTLNVREGTTAIAPYAIGTNYSSVTNAPTNLVTVNLPESVTTIGTYAFRVCKSLQSINLENVTSIESYAFDSCTSLQSVTLNGTIGNNAFKGCTGLTSINFADSTNIVLGNSVFENCTGLTYSVDEPLEIPGGVVRVGDSAFKGCNNLLAVNLNAKLTAASSATAGCGTAIFANCKKLEAVNLGENVKFINNTAFQNCSALASVTMTDNLTVLGVETGGQVFENCTSLESITLSQNLTYISVKTFNGCTKLATVMFGALSRVKKIRNYAFQNCSKLNNIILPSGLTVFGGTNSDPVITADVSVFSGCSSLTSIVVPKGVTLIPANTFKNCTSLTSVEFRYPASVSTTAFSGCPDTLQTTVNNDSFILYNDAYFAQGDEPTELTLVKYIGNATQYTVSAPDGYTVTEIGENAFYGKTALTNVVLPDTVTRISSYAFYGCTGLTSFELPDSVSYIGAYALTGCTSISSIIVDAANIKTFGDYALSGWTAAQTIYVIGVIDYMATSRPSGWSTYWYGGTTGKVQVVWNWERPAEEPAV